MSIKELKEKREQTETDRRHSAADSREAVRQYILSKHVPCSVLLEIMTERDKKDGGRHNDMTYYDVQDLLEEALEKMEQSNV